MFETGCFLISKCVYALLLSYLQLQVKRGCTTPLKVSPDLDVTRMYNLALEIRLDNSLSSLIFPVKTCS